MRRAYSYIRFSTPEQMKGDSLRRQTKLTEDYCKKNRLTIDDSLRLRDLGVSAYRGKNARDGALAAFLEAIAQGRVQPGSVLIVESLDRLSRDQITHAMLLFMDILNKGVTIVTLKPEREYTKKNANDTASIIEALVVLLRAHEESARKADLLKAAWEGKRLKIGEQKLTGRIPAWLTLSTDKKRFHPKPESVKIVKQIFRWAVEGLGVNAITKRLNKEDVCNFGNRSKSGWYSSYVTKILSNRAVLGEFQPHTLDENKKRRPLGNVIPDYYPRVVSDDLFFKARQALASRRNQRGPRGKGVANLFTGLVFDATDDLPMTLVDKGKKSAGAKLVSSGAARGRTGSRYRSISYQLFEQAFLTAQLDVGLSHLSDAGEPPADQVATLSTEIEDIDRRVAACKQAAESDPDITSVLELLRTLEAKKKGMQRQLDEAQAAAATPDLDTWKDVKALVRKMMVVAGEEREQLRVKLKARIRLLVRRIDVQADGKTGCGELIIAVTYRSGKYRFILVEEATGNLIADAYPKTKWELPPDPLEKPGEVIVRVWTGPGVSSHGKKAK